jgi:hypothetical protein
MFTILPKNMYEFFTQTQVVVHSQHKIFVRPSQASVAMLIIFVWKLSFLTTFVPPNRIFTHEPFQT